MKKIWLWLSLAMIFYGGMAMANNVISPIQPVSSILKKLKTTNYVSFQKIELKGEEYEVTALDDKGEITAIRVNCHSGEVIAMKVVNAHVSMLDTIDKVEALGYSDLTKVESIDDYYVIQGLNPAGKPITLRFNAVTESIIKT